MRVALIDADVLLHKACRTLQFDTYYDVNVPDTEYRYARDYIGKKDDRRKASVTGSLTETIECFESQMRTILMNTNATHSIYYLTPSRTFRHDVAVTHPYKEGRSTKPIHFAALKEYIIETHKAVTGLNIEADDCLGIAQTYFNNLEDSTSIICTVDKDLLMVEGLHYNLTTKVISYVSAAEGFMRYTRQLLTGDKIDCIIGIEGIGKIKAEKLLPDTLLGDHRAQGSIVKEQYKKAFGDIWQERLTENRQLLKMLTIDENLANYIITTPVIYHEFFGPGDDW